MSRPVKPAFWIPIAVVLLFAPNASSAPGAFEDDGRRDVWWSAGIGGARAAEADGPAVAVRTGCTGRIGLATATFRYSGYSGLFSEDGNEFALLAGPFLRAGQLCAVPSVGAGWGWGSRDGSIFSSAGDWGPHGTLAYECDLFFDGFPFAGVTIFGSVNRSNSFWGAAVTARFGSFFGEE